MEWPSRRETLEVCDWKRKDAPWLARISLGQTSWDFMRWRSAWIPVYFFQMQLLWTKGSWHLLYIFSVAWISGSLQGVVKKAENEKNHAKNFGFLYCISHHSLVQQWEVKFHEAPIFLVLLFLVSTEAVPCPVVTPNLLVRARTCPLPLTHYHQDPHLSDEGARYGLDLCPHKNLRLNCNSQCCR